MGVDVEHQTLGGVSREMPVFTGCIFSSLLLSFPNEGFLGFIALRGAPQHHNLVNEQRLSEVVAGLPRYM